MSGESPATPPDRTPMRWTFAGCCASANRTEARDKATNKTTMVFIAIPALFTAVHCPLSRAFFLALRSSNSIMVDHTSTLKVLGRLLFLRFYSQSSYAINFKVFCKPISLLLLILWTGNVQSAFLTTPDPEVAKLVKHDH